MFLYAVWNWWKILKFCRKIDVFSYAVRILWIFCLTFAKKWIFPKTYAHACDFRFFFYVQTPPACIVNRSLRRLFQRISELTCIDFVKLLLNYALLYARSVNLILRSPTVPIQRANMEPSLLHNSAYLCSVWWLFCKGHPHTLNG